jgi:hypothetical protein
MKRGVRTIYRTEVRDNQALAVSGWAQGARALGAPSNKSRKIVRGCSAQFVLLYVDKVNP